MPLRRASNGEASDVGRWLASAQSGSPEALGQLLDACRQYLLLVANRELDADLQAKIGPSDVVQETLLEAQLAFGRFQGHSEAEILAWLRKILFNNIANVRDHYRSTQKREIGREVPLDVLLDGPATAPLFDKLPSPSKNAVARERLDELEQALSQLSEPYREALRLRHQENRSFDEIGQALGRSAEAARKLWARGVEQLRQILKTTHEPN